MSIASQRTPLLYNNKQTQHIDFQNTPKQPPCKQSQPQSTTHHSTPTTPSSTKLGTFDGVFIPTSLNVLSILMFLRFGFIIGQLGILGTLLILIMSYFINLLTVLSISAIATNGTVRGGGAYYMISRSLGVEFGGSIGLIFYFGQVLNSGLNVVGIIEPLLNNFGLGNGQFYQVLPSGGWVELIYATILLFCCICVALVGSALVSKCGGVLFVLLLFATVSIPISVLFVQPFIFKEYDLLYTGPTWDTIKSNFFPEFTKGAAGSLLDTKETFQDLFGIFFPATAGIFAGASMSGDLRNPSKSIPKGTIWGLLLTFVCYALVIVALGSSVPRELLRKDITIIQDVNASAVLIFIGELATSLFSIIVGIVGAANVLQAIAKDSIFPFLKPFEKVTKQTNNPINAILFTWVLTQVCLFANVNQIATFITMAFLMTFIVTNLACFLLKLGSAPNFRPSFKYFNWFTALSGLISSFIAMFIVDSVNAAVIVVFLIVLFLLIHYVSPPKQWGDVSQSLIYHQVRKYLLRLRQDNVKYWRPQILLLVDDARSSWNLIQFCNNLKKGGLYILGHVINTGESFQDNFEEFQKQTNAWIKLRDISKIKAFVQIGLGPSLPWGVRNVILGSGLGGMKPNIVVMGFLNRTTNAPLDSAKRHPPSTKISINQLPTDICRTESPISFQNWVNIIEDLILMRTNVAVAKGFENMHIPNNSSHTLPLEERPYIDLYPIQMSVSVANNEKDLKSDNKGIMTTNFDTYTLILQLGAILTTVPNWKRTHRLRIVLFIEDMEDMENERDRISSLLEILRIQAIIKVVCLKDFKSYNTIVKGAKTDFQHVDTVLKDDEFWGQLKEIRAKQHRMSVPDTTFNQLRQRRLTIAGAIGNNNVSNLLDGAGLIGTSISKRFGIGKLQKMGVSLTMTSNKFNHGLLNNDAYDDEEDDISSSADTSDLESASSHQNNLINDPPPVVLDDFTSRFKPTTTTDTSMFKKQYLPKMQTRAPESLYVSKNRPDLNASSSTLDIKSLKKKPVPNFSSEKLLRSKVIDDAMGDEPSIMLVPEDDEEKGADVDEGDEGSMSSASRGNTLNKKSKNRHKRISNKTMKKDSVGKSVNHPMDRKGEFCDDWDTQTTQTAFNGDSQDPRSISTVSLAETADEVQEEDGSNEDDDPMLIDIAALSFDDLPAKAQHLVLNDIMKTISSKSGVIFSTLPAPVIGTHYSVEESIEYVQNLEVWCHGLNVPVMFINSQSMTVTAAL